VNEIRFALKVYAFFIQLPIIADSPKIVAYSLGSNCIANTSASRERGRKGWRSEILRILSRRFRLMRSKIRAMNVYLVHDTVTASCIFTEKEWRFETDAKAHPLNKNIVRDIVRWYI